MEPPGKINYLLEQVILRFILNLRPNTRNTSSELIPSTLFSVLHEFLRDKDRLRERTTFWDFDADNNIMPLKDVDGGFWFAPWELKIRILRQLVDWQLTYAANIRDIIDTAWQVKQKPNNKKKNEPPRPAPDTEAAATRKSLTVTPLGQDVERTRFWIADNSPRLYTSTNPWKTTQLFKCVATTREDYIEWIDKLREKAPPEVEEDDGRTVDSKHKMHWDLIYALELRVDLIDEDLRRAERVRKRLTAEAEKASLLEQSINDRRSRLRSRQSADSERDENGHHFGIQRDDSADSQMRSRSADEVPDTRETSPSHDDRLTESHKEEEPEIHSVEELGENVEELDELQDDSSLIAESDDGGTRGGKKRRRRPTPPSIKPTRVSTRKKQKREEQSTVISNGTQVNGQPTTSVKPVHAPKNSKGQDNKFWYYEESIAAPSKRPPEMLDDPDAVLKARRGKKKVDAMLDQTIDPVQDPTHSEQDLKTEGT